MYKIGLLDDEVTRLVAAFDARDARYWNVSLAEIARDPLERFGQYAERLIEIKGFPTYTHNYWINEHTSAGGERIFVFTAEYFDYRPVYVVDEESLEVGIFAVRARWTYDPM